jgi:endonuclease YncB( thermonuclease family)
MQKRLAYLLLLLVFLVAGACHSKSGQLEKPGEVTSQPINQWVSEPGENHSDSAEWRAAEDPSMQNPATLSSPEDDHLSNLAQTEPKKPEARTSKESIEGKVIGIVDGDTFDLLDDSNQTIRIRMEGIDAPERGMPFYQVAKKQLSSLCFGKRIVVQITQAESGNRKIGFSYLSDGTELSHAMIRAGLAWHFTRYNDDPDLARLEQEAREARRGLWKDPNPIPPWEIRKIRRGGESTKELFNITEEQR